MRIVIIGSGNVATHLAQAFIAAKMEVAQIWSHQYQHAVALASKINSTAIQNLNEIDLSADYCVVAIKDDAIAEMVNALIDFKGVVVHTSGAVSTSVFDGKIAKYGVLYPLQTFSKSKSVDFNTIPICIEGNSEQTIAKIKILANMISAVVTEVDSEKRKILHLAAVFACNFPNHLYAMAAQLLDEHKLPFDIIKPLILETAAKVQSALPIEVQTGPAVRGDEQTLKKHEELLLNEPQLLNIYKTLSESIKKAKK